MTLKFLIKIWFLQKSLLRIFTKNFKITIYVLQRNLAYIIKIFVKSLKCGQIWNTKVVSFRIWNPDSLGINLSCAYWFSIRQVNFRLILKNKCQTVTQITAVVTSQLYMGKLDLFQTEISYFCGFAGIVINPCGPVAAEKSFAGSG